MNDNIVVKAEHVSKKFCRRLRTSMRYGAQDIVKSVFRMSTRPDRLRKHEFWAVNDVSFELARGECLGVIGANGSGKSTLLQMLNGIFMPNKGSIEISGRTGALIQIGAGFHPVLTGRENIYINGAILGMTRREIDRKFDEIIKFADIGDFIDTPVKNYSSGMFVRLGFAIAIHCEPDILLIDEILSVGDENFREKSAGRIVKYLDSGGSAVFVSHNLQTIRVICDRAALLSKGKLVSLGSPDDVIEDYFESISSSRANGEGESVSSEIKIDSVNILGVSENAVSTVEYGESVRVKVNYTAFKKLFRPFFFVQIFRGRHLVFTYHMMRLSGDWTIDKGSGFVELHLPQLFLSPGKYDIVCGIQKHATMELGVKYYVLPWYFATFEVESASFVNKFKVTTDLAGLESLAPAYLPFSWNIMGKSI
ncbi:polysaccharide ABC transporter ATP-binding protein [Chloroflexota bacterium]